MKTAYTILDPTMLDAAAMLSRPDKLVWIEHTFTIPQGAVIPDYRGFVRLLTPLFNEGGGTKRDFEHVSVNSFNGPTDMFVDDMGPLDGHPVNEAATLIYWSATILHEMARKGGIETADEYQHRHAEALQVAARRFANDYRLPKIHGRAILFRDRVWF